MSIFPTETLSITRFSLDKFLLIIEVFVLKFSTNASCDPIITGSFLGSPIERLSNFLTSMSKQKSIVSIKRAQFPESTSFTMSSKEFTFFTSVCTKRVL